MKIFVRNKPNLVVTDVITFLQKFCFDLYQICVNSPMYYSI